MNRVARKQVERASKRDPLLEASLIELYQKDEKQNSVAQIMIDEKGYEPTA